MTKRSKKLTRKEKKELSDKLICWKCSGKMITDKQTKKCTSCGFEVTIKRGF